MQGYSAKCVAEDRNAWDPLPTLSFENAGTQGEQACKLTFQPTSVFMIAQTSLCPRKWIFEIALYIIPLKDSKDSVFNFLSRYAAFWRDNFINTQCLDSNYDRAY